MVILYAIIGAVTTVGIILLRYYLAERKKPNPSGNFSNTPSITSSDSGCASTSFIRSINAFLGNKEAPKCQVVVHTD